MKEGRLDLCKYAWFFTLKAKQTDASFFLKAQRKLICNKWKVPYVQR